MKLKQKGYRLSAIPVIEIIGSILIFATLFMPWMKMNGPFGVSEGLKFSDESIYIIVFGVACFANVVLKLFRRSTWASVPITICGIGLLIWVSYVYSEFRKADDYEIKMAEALIGKEMVTLDIGYYLALFASAVMLICIIRGWLTYLSSKSKNMPREWYKNKDDENTTEDNGIVNEGIADAQRQMDVEPVKEPASPESVEKPQDTAIDIEQDKEKDDKKKWYYIGGAVAAVLIAAGNYFAFSGGSSNENNPLGVQKPKWEKFVMVNAIDVMLYKEADTSSPNLRLAVERLDGCMPGEKMLWAGDKVPRGYDAENYPLKINTVLPVLDESDEWYKVYTGTGEIREAYLQKKYSEEVKPEPITNKIIDNVKTSDRTTQKLVEKGEFANLYLECFFDEMGGGEKVMVGALVKGCIVAPEACCFYPVKTDTMGISMRNISYSPDYSVWHLDCPEKYWKTSSLDADGIFDVNLLTDSDIQKIVTTLHPQGKTASTVYYYFPTVARDRFISFEYSFSPAAAVEVEEGKATVTDFRVENEKLIATVDGEDREVDLDFGNIELFGVKDLDGDGSMEAVISHFMSGANGASVDCPFVVYYDADSDKFKQTDEMKLTYESEPEFEGSDDSITMVQREGLRMISYVFEGGKLVVNKDEFKNVGSVVGKVTLDELFSDKEDGEKSISVDYLDDDDVTLTFTYEASGHYHGYKMALKKMEFPNGRVIDTDFSADTFEFLKEKTNGMPDFIGDNYLYRWDGSRYVSYGWNGNKLVEDWSL